MHTLITILTRAGLLTEDLDYHVVRAAMVILFLFFGYQKWFAYEAQVLIPYISNGPLLAWMYPVFGIRGASWCLGVAEWVFGMLLFAGFWNKKCGILGLSVPVRPSSGPSLLFPLCPMAGRPRPADFQP